MLTASELARVLDIGLPAGRENTALELAVAATIEAVQAYTGREWAEITDDTEPTARTYPGCASVVLIADVVATDTVRLVAAGAGPAMAIAAASVLPVEWLPLVAVLHVFWFWDQKVV